MIANKKTLGKVVRPQSWFKGDGGKNGAPTGEAAGKTNALIYEPKDGEADAIMAAKPCIGCRWFRYNDGQHTMQTDRTTQMLAYELRWTSFVESLNPMDLGACAVHEHALTSKYATCDSWTPKDEHHKSVWARVKAALGVGT